MSTRNWILELDKVDSLSPEGVCILFDGLEDQPVEQNVLEAHLRVAELDGTRAVLSQIHQAGSKIFMTAVQAQVRSENGTHDSRWVIGEFFRSGALRVLATAALICLVAGLWWWSSSPRPSSGAYAAAYGAMITSLENALSVSWVQTDHANSAEARSTTYFVDNQGRMRYEMEGPRGATYHIEYLLTRDWYKFFPSEKTVVLRKSLALDVSAASQLDKVRGLLDEFCGYTRRETLDGVPCYVYSCDDRGSVVYMDVESHLPVRILVDADGTKTEFADIKWNNVDPAIFNSGTPEGWSLHDMRTKP